MMRKTFFLFLLILLINTNSAETVTQPTASVKLHGEKTDVVLGEDIILKLSAVNIITKPQMTVQVILIPPSGMSVSAAEFIQSGSAQYTSTFQVEPGGQKNIDVRITANQIGDFNVEGRVVYYYGDNLSTAEDFTLALPIKVRPVTTPTEITRGGEQPLEPDTIMPTIAAIIAVILILVFLYKLIKRTPSAPAPEEAEQQPVQPLVSAPTKFQIGPTVKLRPVVDVIEAEEDGIVELSMDNPSLNDATLHVEARISVPSGFHIYGQGFAQASGGGSVYSRFDVPPGITRAIAIVVKVDKSARIGSHILQFSGLYYPGDNKDNYQQISLTYPVTVKEASKRPESSQPSHPEKIQKGAETPNTKE